MLHRCCAESVVREFNTARFRVTLGWEPDLDADASFDETGETQRGLDAETLTAFCAVVRVYWHDCPVSFTILGGCIYERPSDFFQEHRKGGASYIRDLVREAIDAARSRFSDVELVKLHQPRASFVVTQDARL